MNGVMWCLHASSVGEHGRDHAVHLALQHIVDVPELACTPSTVSMVNNAQLESAKHCQARWTNAQLESAEPCTQSDEA